MGKDVFLKHLREKRAIKISIASDNYDYDYISKICQSGQIAKVSAIEVNSEKTSYETARKNTRLPIFIKSINPFKILESVKMGADGVLIGDYYNYYKNNRNFTSSEIYDIILEIMGMINDYDVCIGASLPAYLSFNEQVYLSRKLQVLGVHYLQMEGYGRTPQNPDIIVEDANLAIKNIAEFNRYINIPVIAGAMNDLEDVKKAFEYGACGISAQSMISKLETQVMIKAQMTQMVGCVAYRNSINKELARGNGVLLKNQLL